MRLRRPIVCALAALSLAAAGCSEEETNEAKEEAATERPDATTEASAPETAKPRAKPKIEKPTGAPPDELAIEDLIKGKGSAADAGDRLTLNYVGVSFKNGKEFDSSFTAGQPFQFELGAGEVIPGWDQGLVGMKVGGRRKLTIPPELAYGDTGSPPTIGPNETLVFVVDLLGRQ